MYYASCDRAALLAGLKRVWFGWGSLLFLVRWGKDQRQGGIRRTRRPAIGSNSEYLLSYSTFVILFLILFLVESFASQDRLEADDFRSLGWGHEHHRGATQDTSWSSRYGKITHSAPERRVSTSSIDNGRYRRARERDESV